MIIIIKKNIQDRNPRLCPGWISFSKPAHVMGFSIGFVALGTYFGTMGGMVAKYFRVKRFFREQEMELTSHNDNSLDPE